MKHIPLVLGTAAVIAGLGMSGGAQALTATKKFYQNATGFCQPSLPAFDGNIRKRPTAVANEGTSAAFVSCSGPTSAEDTTGVSSLNLVLYNRTAAAISVTCSLVDSFTAGGLVVPKTVSIPANNRAFFTWTLADVGSPPSMQWANFNCGLPPSTDVGYLFYDYTYDIGA